jgi:LPPG:FO 2-phospho-L-lactate transferase
VARYYRDWVDGFVLDVQDAALADDIAALGLRARLSDTMMRNDADKRRLAAEVLDFVDELAVSGQHS